MIRVLIADDQTLIRKGMRVLLQRSPDIEVVGEARDGRQAVDMAWQLFPDVIVMDAEMPVMDGMEATRLIRAANMRTQVIMFSMHDDQGMMERAHASGAQAYLLKSGSPEEIATAVRAAYHLVQHPSNSATMTGTSNSAGIKEADLPGSSPV